MAGESFQHSWAVCRTPWHNEVARVIMLVMASLLSVIPTVARAESQITPDPFADNELAAVILLKDKGRDVEGKLGAPCVAPAVNRESVSLAYRAADGTSLRFVVNVSPSDVHYQLVESMTMSMEPNVSVTCYTPAYASLNIEFSKIHTGRGIRLGESMDQIISQYGEPDEKQAVNTDRVRLQYDSGYETDRYYQWTLTFRDGRLVEWTADAIPFFIEVGG